MGKLEEKLANLSRNITQLERVVVAFSGGVDSSLVLKVAADCLGKQNVLAVTVRSPLMPHRDLETAVRIARELQAPHRIIETDELQDAQIVANTPQRCYYCKRHTFELLTGLARREGYRSVLEGSNNSDTRDYRPGLAAVRSFEMVRSPLQDCGLEKNEIRQIARLLGLKNWDRPARPCLASRIPYGEPLSLEKLEMVDRAEDRLAGLGLKNVRVRYHGTVARIEIDPDEMPGVLEPELLRQISREVKACGFTYVALDLDGYRTGSLNEVIGDEPESLKNVEKQ
ncbi:MAG TPA: ATP-dependent sacrificial sulfur transferase LarE [Syntrophomonadaceae bacterium]|nr:ATP-dependent sacrificial sulfur transferase LarE [Syntrophomonadaceae bacterium]